MSACIVCSRLRWYNNYNHQLRSEKFTVTDGLVCFMDYSVRVTYLLIHTPASIIRPRSQSLWDQQAYAENTNGGGRHNSFSPPFPPLPPSLLPSFTPQLNQLEGLGSAVSSPMQRPKTNSVHSRAVRKPLMAIILSVLKCMFYSRSVSYTHLTLPTKRIV